jgi:hypothetical protein
MLVVVAAVRSAPLLIIPVAQAQVAAVTAHNLRQTEVALVLTEPQEQPIQAVVAVAVVIIVIGLVKQVVLE